MKRAALLVLVCAAAALGLARSAHARPCGLPDGLPVWIEYAQGSVQFRNQIFAHPGIVAATSGPYVSAALRKGGAATIYWELSLPRLAGTPAKPADPAGVEAAANALVDKAVADTGCPTPWIALNELLAPTAPSPWSPSLTQYRANVMTVLKTIAGRGATPFLLVPSQPNVGSPETEGWWKEAAQYAGIVRETYYSGTSLQPAGALIASRAMRIRLRDAIRLLTRIGVPPERQGYMIGFQAKGLYGRTGLPRDQWLELVKLISLAAKQVAADTNVGTVWSWGWGAFSADADSPAAACVYLWARDSSLCDGPAAAGAGFDADLTEGQIDLEPGVQCAWDGGSFTIDQFSRAQTLTNDPYLAETALIERGVQSAQVDVSATDVLKAEAAIVKVRFGGKVWRYRHALQGNHVTLDFARGVIADELRRQRLNRMLRTQSPPQTLADWSEAQEQEAIKTLTCLQDVIPNANDVRLAAFLAFLQLPGA